MLDRDVFDKKAELFVILDEKRTWKTLWLKKTQIKKRVFCGHVNSIHKDGYQGTVIELVDPVKRLHQTTYVKASGKDTNENVPYLRPWLHELKVK